MPVEWTPEQNAILAHNKDVSARILAGPGTGKSATMVEWVGRILRGVPVPNVKVLTFTRAATSELTRKVADHPATAALRPSTIHSFAISTLLQNPGVGEFPEPLRIADDWEQSQIVNKSLGRRINVRAGRVNSLFIELAANWEALEERENPRVDPQERARFLAGWQQHRRVLGYTLLSELPWALSRALLNHPDLMGIDHDLLVVDEYQDLNACDLEVLRLLAERGKVIVAVGDDDQSIYSFRRAAPEGIRRFLGDYHGSVDYPLSITHRCGSRIMEWASYVIAQDLGRDPNKPMPTPTPDSPPGEVLLLSFAGERAEPDGVAHIVDNLINRENIAPSEVLILLRSDYNQQFSRPIKEALALRGIQFADPNEVKEQLGSPENRRLLAYSRLIANRSDSLAWATLLKLTPRTGDRSFDAIYDKAVLDGTQFGVALLAAYGDRFPDLPVNSRSAVTELIRSALNWLDNIQVPDECPENGWGHWMIALGGTGPAPRPTQEFEEILRGVDEVVDAESDFARYLGQIVPTAKDRAQSVSDRVRIMTMAASKGLTVEATIVAAAEEGIVPSLRPGVDINEERRLLYVAMTRAKRFLCCTWARQRSGPTARAGRERIRERRNHSASFDGGPVQSQEGMGFIENRWPRRR